MNPSISRRRFAQLSLASGCLAASGRTWAAPSETLSIVVPHEPGGGIDLIARRLANALDLAPQATVVVSNRPGASGLVGAASVARSRKDGSTLLFNGVGHITSPLLHADKHYEPTEDFVGIATIGRSPSVLMTHGNPAGDPAQIIRAAKPDDAYASSGFGTSAHLSAALFVSRHRLNWLHVPYKGTGPALRALMAGDVRWMFVPSSSVAAAASSGRARPLAVAHPTRIATLPDVPTFKELGIEGIELSQWYALFAPAGTPRARRAALAQAARRATADPGFVEFMRSQSIEPFWLELEQMDDWLRREHAALSDWVARMGPSLRS